jgi:hypothetical protein
VTVLDEALAASKGEENVARRDSVDGDSHSHHQSARLCAWLTARPTARPT